MLLKSDKLFVYAAGVILVATMLVVPSHLLLADNIVPDEVRRCASIDDAVSRLACYDKVSGREDRDPVVLAAANEQQAEDFGSEMLPHQKDKEGEDDSVVARVTECTKDVREKYLFHLKSGQVWKQVSDKRLHFKTCDFNVTISKDYFGYKMQQEGSKSRFRVSRIK